MNTPGSPPPPDPIQSWLGTAGILSGALLFCLGFVAEMTGRLPFFMPRSWYVSRPLWYFLAVACCVGGGFLLKHRPRRFRRWTSTTPGLRFHRIVLYSRAACELCREAEQTLSDYEDYLPPAHLVDIDGDRRLIQRFGVCVPVVEIDGKLRFRGRLDEMLLRRLIEGTPPLESSLPSGRIA